jgi:Zn-dependent peptidase ImmA (M78 family)
MGVHLCKRGCIFVTINTGLALNKQIFAAAHELYHIYRYVNDQKDDFAARGSLLTTKEADTPCTSEEDCEANAFQPSAGLSEDEYERSVSAHLGRKPGYGV